MPPLVKIVKNPDHISVLVPTRARTMGLEKMLRSLAETALDKNLVDVWIYVDDDDRDTQNFLSSNTLNNLGVAIHTLVGERPLSQGEICNNLCRQADTGGGIFFSTCDDYRFATRGWDQVVREGFKRYPDNVLMAFPKDPTAAPGQATHMILGAQWVNGVGRFLTDFFPFWYDDAWIDDVASLIGRKVQLDFEMSPQGGKGKTPRMKNLIFWEKFYLDTLDDRLEDAKNLLAKINLAPDIDFPERGSQAEKILKRLWQRRARVDVRKLKNIEAQLSDQGSFWNRMQANHLPAVNYLVLENRAVTHLLTKINPLMAKGQYEKILFIFDTLSHGIHSLEMVDSLSDYVQMVTRVEQDPNHKPPAVQNSATGSVSHTHEMDRLDQIIAPEIMNDGLFHAIRRIAAQDDVQTALEIGASDGAGSTQAFLAGLGDKSDLARLFCMEMSEGRYQKLRERVGGCSHVHCVNASSVSIDRFPTAEEIADFYHQHQTALNAYSLTQVQQWLNDDKTYMTDRQKNENGIQRIKAENNITHFDMVLIDGSEFTGRAELADVYGAKYILLDDTRGYKNYDNYHRLCDDPVYQLIEEDPTLRNGYAVFQRKEKQLPIHFFTIVLNGEPFIQYHLNVFFQLPLEWHWHVIEGVADLKHDTAWSLNSGGRIDGKFHKEGLSVDGTSTYLDAIAAKHADRVTLYRKPQGKFWDGKLEMVNAPMPNLPEACLLWQIDADELWTPEQIQNTHSLFEKHPDKTAAFFHCHFFIGPELLTVTPRAYSHHDHYEWLRVWRYRRGMQWKSHEPPCLMAQVDGRWQDSAHIAPFTHHETEAAGLVFTHHAYSIESQVRFKESYYGYKNAVDHWRKLQQAHKFPVRVRSYLPWVTDDCLADHMDRRTIGQKVPPLRLDSVTGNHIIQDYGYSSPHIVIDGVIFQLQARQAQGISRVWSNLILELAQQMPQAKITLLQRGQYTVPGRNLQISQVSVFSWDNPERLDQDDEMLRRTCRELGADLFVSTYYTRAPGVLNLVMVHDMIPEKLGMDLTQAEWVAKQRVIETADAFVCVSKTTRSDLVEIYPQVAKRPMTVAYNGLDPCFRVPSRHAVRQLRQKLNLHGPYVMLVGNRHGYKNGLTVLRSLAAIENEEKPIVLCIGGESQLSPDEQRLKEQLDIRYVEPLDDKELATAYGGALALLVGSRYEGFGLPVIEAMACACPVIAHASAAVSEVGGDAVRYVDMATPEDLQKALGTVAVDHQRRHLVQRGQDRCAKFKWSASARIIGDFMHTLLERPAILLTAIVSTYNAVRFIQGCLNDLVQQTLVDQMEIIVVDSASEQDEAAIVRDFQSRHANIKYMRTHERESVYQAWNRGIKFALGKYVTNANTDDRHRRDAFELMAQVLEENGAIVLVYADVVKTGTANETFKDCTPTGFLRWPEWNRDALLEKGCFIGPQPVWRRSVHDDYGYFDASFHISADYEFWLRISQTYDFQHIPQTLGLYLEREDSIEHSDRPQKKHEDHKIITAYTDAAASGRIIGPSDDPSHAVGADIVHSNHQQQTIHPAIRVQDTKGGENQGDPLMSTQETILIAIEDMIAKGQKEAACWAMDKMLADYPDHPELHSQRAAMAYEQGDMDQALQHFETAAALAPRNAFIQRQVGDFFYVVKKDGPKALAQYEKALTVAPDDVEILMLAGHVSLTLHQYPQARDYYQQVRRIDPSNSDVQQFLDKLNQQPTIPQANPISVDELYTSAQAKVQDQQGQVAIGLLEQLLKKEPEHPLSHNDLGVLYYEAGDMEQAQTHYESACRLEPENETFQKNLADFYWVALQDPNRALQQYIQALKLNPQDVETLLSCAQICLAVHQKTDAHDFLDAVRALEPWNEDAKQMQVQLEGRTESPETVSDAVPDIAPAASMDTAVGTDDLYHQAKDKAAAGDLGAAIDLLNQVLGCSPDQAHCHNELGVLYYETGAKEKALASYEQAVRLAPLEANYAKNLADFYLIEQERAQDAMKLYLGVLEQNPEDVEALTATALVCASIGNVADARHFYDRILEIEPWNQSAMDAVAQLEQQAGPGGHPEGHTAAAG